MSVLTDEDKERIRSKAIYWNKVTKRENGRDILTMEMREEIRILGLKILWVLEEAAKDEK